MRVYEVGSGYRFTGTYIEVAPNQFLDLVIDENQIPSEYCPTDEEKNKGTGFVIGTFTDTAMGRGAENLSPQSTVPLFVYDIDYMTPGQIAIAAPFWAQYNCALYTTCQHTQESPRYRLLIELDTEVPQKKEIYKKYYLEVAKYLGVSMDPKTVDNVRFFYWPQHRYIQKAERFRFYGKPFPIAEISVPATNITTGSGHLGVSNAATEVSGKFQVTADKPTSQALKKLALRFRKGSGDYSKSIASVLEAILRKEPYAPKGSRHNTTLYLTLELVREWSNLDAEWFAETYLISDIWPLMWGYDSNPLQDWVTSVAGAKLKIAEQKEQKRKAITALEIASGSLPANTQFAPTTPEINQNDDKRRELTSEEYDSVVQHAGRLVVSVKGYYFIFSPIQGKYKGPYKSTETAIALREYLGMIPEIVEYYVRKSGVVLKTAVEIAHQYGCVGEDVIWMPTTPKKDWDPKTKTLYIQTYKWMEWEPKRHKIVEELLEALGGDKTNLLIKYLYKFRDLSQPLPALTFVGSAKTWKSKICMILSRFWTDRDIPHANRAEKVMTRFNDALLLNPTVWSDECLAKDNAGRARPELYRESITAPVQHIEGKGLPTCRLMSCVRHLVTANNDSKIFSYEVDSDSILATMNRFLLIYTDKDRINDFEKKWAGTEEITALREGTPLLEYITWIEKTFTFESVDRLFIQPIVDINVLLRSRFHDDTLNYILGIALEALDNETRMSIKNQGNRLPIVMDNEGNLRLSPVKIMSLWSMSKLASGSGVKKPTAQKIGDLLAKAGFKADKAERAVRAPLGAWKIHIETFKEFLEVSEQWSWQDVVDRCIAIFGMPPKE